MLVWKDIECLGKSMPTVIPVGKKNANSKELTCTDKETRWNFTKVVLCSPVQAGEHFVDKVCPEVPIPNEIRAVNWFTGNHRQWEILTHSV